MARTTAGLVATIIEVDLAIDLTPFILVANELVTEVCGSAGHTAERLELIERWLSAHFYTNRDPRAVTEKADVVSVTNQSAVDLNLNSSHYGQTAMMLDTSGGLSTLNQNRPTKAASVLWAGTPYAASL